MNDKQPQKVDPTAIYTVPQAAEAMQMDKRTIYKLIDNGALPALKYRTTHRIAGDSLLACAGSQTYQGQPVNHGGSGGMGAKQGNQPF